MALKLYDTLTRAERAFEPLDPSNVRMYVCGPTVYSYAHIGNARPVVVFDTLFRLLRHLYGIGRVTYVRNITDIDDKIIEASRQSGEPIEAITARTAKAYQDDMAALGALDPTHQPRATRYVGSMVRMIETLIARGHAYAAEGHVLFHVPSMPDYGKLSRHNRDELVAGARVDVAPYKRDPADFVLWKPSTADQPGWDSPWGRGRPGWHIECSAMSEDLLGETFDIHGGGQDLVFPHHENEIAQSACAHSGQPHARYWMHNGFLTVDQEKMSKSIGNVVTVHGLLEQGWPGEAIRLVLLSAHYRQPVDFSEENLRQAKATLDRWYLALNESGGPSPEVVVPDSVVAALEADLNTPLAIAALHELASELNKARGDARDEARARFQGGAHLLGLLHQDPEVWLKAGTSDADEARIEHLVAARIAAKKARNFAEADRIRAELAAEGILLEDTAQGTRWRRG